MFLMLFDFVCTQMSEARDPRKESKTRLEFELNEDRCGKFYELSPSQGHS